MNISSLEREALIDYIEAALVEMEEDENLSQGVIDGLHEALAILGAKRKPNAEHE